MKKIFGILILILFLTFPTSTLAGTRWINGVQQGAGLNSLEGLTITAGDMVVAASASSWGVLDHGETTKILVGGGATYPVWTTATGSGAPVRANSPTFVALITMGSAALNEAELEIIDGATLTTTQLNYLNAATGTTGTTSSNLVFSTSPVLVTPTLGDATATSITLDASATPGWVFRDSGNPGTDKEIAKIYANFLSGADGAEDGGLYLQAMLGGSEITWFEWDSDTEVATMGDSGTGEDLTWDFETATDNEVAVGTNSGTTRINYGAINLVTSGMINGGISSTVLTTAEGTDDTSSGAAFLTDSGESWGTNAYVGMTLYNTTDGSSCVVTANNGTTMTCTLAGGTNNDWDSGDVWEVAPGPYQSGGIFYIGSATTIRHPATAGYAAVYYSTAASTIKVDPQSGSMQFTLNGTPTGTNGEELDSAGAAGDFIAIHNQSATVGVTLGRSGTWTDGGAS